MNVKFIAILTLSMCVAGVSAQPNSSFYVSTNGNDSNPGTETAPWRSIQHAADTVLPAAPSLYAVEFTKSS